MRIPGDRSSRVGTRGTAAPAPSVELPLPASKHSWHSVSLRGDSGPPASVRGAVRSEADRPVDTEAPRSRPLRLSEAPAPCRQPGVVAGWRAGVRRGPAAAGARGEPPAVTVCPPEAVRLAQAGVQLVALTTERGTERAAPESGADRASRQRAGVDRVVCGSKPGLGHTLNRKHRVRVAPVLWGWRTPGRTRLEKGVPCLVPAVWPRWCPRDITAGGTVPTTSSHLGRVRDG